MSDTEASLWLKAATVLVALPLVLTLAFILSAWILLL